VLFGFGRWSRRRRRSGLSSIERPKDESIDSVRPRDTGRELVGGETRVRDSEERKARARTSERRSRNLISTDDKRVAEANNYTD
jgi:hypothetical protein